LKLREEIAAELMTTAYVDVEAEDVMLTWRPVADSDVELTDNAKRISQTPLANQGGVLVANLMDRRMGMARCPKAPPPVPSSDPTRLEHHTDDDDSPARVADLPFHVAAALPAAVLSPCVAAVPTSVRHAAYPQAIEVEDLVQAADAEFAAKLRSVILKIATKTKDDASASSLPSASSQPSASASSLPSAPGQGRAVKIEFVPPKAASSSSGKGNAIKRKEPDPSTHEGCPQQ